jgi:hypothetical protein
MDAHASRGGHDRAEPMNAICAIHRRPVGPAAVARSDTAARRSRRWRVGLLLLAAALMGVADLACTLAYMRSVGMIELNPIARHMIAVGGAQQLVVYKLFTIALTCGSIFLIREHRRAEVGAWMCAAIMLALTLHWVRYNRDAPSLTHELSFIALSEDRALFREWVVITD